MDNDERTVQFPELNNGKFDGFIHEIGINLIKLNLALSCIDNNERTIQTEISQIVKQIALCVGGEKLLNYVICGTINMFNEYRETYRKDEKCQ